MSIFALDANIISYILKKDAQVLANMKRETGRGSDCIIPPVAYYEVRRGLLLVNSAKRLQAFDFMCDEFPVGKMSKATWSEAARLYTEQRKRGYPAEDADIFIAAFCLVGGYTLVTNNLRHFEQIDGLVCVNWKE